jgi:signal transduction histidine kinase
MGIHGLRLEIAVAEERLRIARELHDRVGATLFTIGAGIRSLGARLDGGTDVIARMRAIEDQAAEVSGALRTSLDALSAPPEQLALPAMLRQDCRAFEGRTSLPARLVVLTGMPPLGRSKLTALALAVRAALLDAERHGGAASVVVTVFADPGRVAATVCDDGSERAAGPEMTAARERLNRAGGDFHAASGEDGGLTVRAWVPA